MLLLTVAACLLPLLFAAVAVGLGALLWERSQQIDEQQAAIERLRHQAELARRDDWLQAVKAAAYRNETEVEVKFIAPMVRYLGYGIDDMAIRVRLRIKVGRSEARSEADWVLSVNGVPRVVIEAKAPGVTLDQDAIEQAQSYAVAVNALAYILTNGHSLIVFQRGIQSDRALVNCSAAELADEWHRVQHVVGKAAMVEAERTHTDLPQVEFEA
jgi:hypothetical protein